MGSPTKNWSKLLRRRSFGGWRSNAVHLGKLEIDDLTVKRLRVIEHAGDDLA